MRVVHGSRLVQVERNGRWTILSFFCDNEAAVTFFQDEPGMIGVDAGSVTKPAKASPRRRALDATLASLVGATLATLSQYSRAEEVALPGSVKRFPKPDP